MTPLPRRSTAGASLGVSVLAVMVVIGLFTGCTGKPGDSSNVTIVNEAPPPTEGAPKSNPAAPAPELNTTSTGKKTIAIISPAKTSEFHNELPKGAAEEAICPYCSTLYRFDASLDAGRPRPAEAFWQGEAA